jgi:hypothetical protein
VLIKLIKVYCIDISAAQWYMGKCRIGNRE